MGEFVTKSEYKRICPKCGTLGYPVFYRTGEVEIHHHIRKECRKWYCIVKEISYQTKCKLGSENVFAKENPFKRGGGFDK